jgi:glycosyltransferase involved in cell wall biosynthesis
MYHGNLAANLARRLAGGRQKVIWSIRHAMHSLGDNKATTALAIRIGARLSRSADCIIYNSRTSARQHTDYGYDASRAIVIPNGFDTARFRPSAENRASWRKRLGVSDDTVVIARVGRLHPVKDHPTFLAAARRVAQSAKNVAFALVGNELTEANLAFGAVLRDMHIGAPVHLLGMQRDTATLYPAFDIVCSSSRSEAFPNVIGESMSCSVPCVVTDVGDSRWIVGETGVAVPPRDPELLAKGLLELIQAGARTRAELGARGRERIVRDFSLVGVSRQLRDVYGIVLRSEDLSVAERVASPNSRFDR